MTEQATPSITVNDVAAMLQIIDAAAQRGAFRGEELSSVGAVRDKAAVFVDHVKSLAEAAAEPNEEEVEGAAV